MAAATILHQNGIEPVLQLTCRDRNRLALQSDLLGAAALGIRNLLVLRGDDPSAGDQPDAKPVFDLDSGALIQTAVGIRDRGELPSGRKVTGKADFFIGAADMPIDPPKDWQPKSLKGKIAAGAQFAQTQFCMDIEIVRRYVARLAEDGLTDQISLLIGVVPLRSGPLGALDQGAALRRDHSRRHRGAAGIFRRCGGRGQQICVDFIEQLADRAGRRGRAHHGAEQRGGDPGRDCESAQAGEESRAGVLSCAQSTPFAGTNKPYGAPGNVRDRQRLQDQDHARRAGRAAAVPARRARRRWPGCRSWSRCRERFDVIVPEHPGFGALRHAGLAR